GSGGGLGSCRRDLQCGRACCRDGFGRGEPDEALVAVLALSLWRAAEESGHPGPIWFAIRGDAGNNNYGAFHLAQSRTFPRGADDATQEFDQELQPRVFLTPAAGEDSLSGDSSN